jgi:DNA-binding NarL/FixJ family response regulator
VFIVDDHEIVRARLQTMLSRQDGISVVGKAATVTEAIGGSSRLKPDVVLMDVRMLSDSGVDACRAIRESCPNTRVLFLSSSEDSEAVLAAVVAGASGYLVKHENAEELLRARAIPAVAQRQSMLDPTVTQPLLTHLPVRKEVSGPLQTTLSTQQQRVLELIAQGKTNKEIGRSLQLSDQTVKNYIRFIFQKLNVTRRAHAAALFTRYAVAEKRSADNRTNR